MSHCGLATLRDYIRWAISQFSREQVLAADNDQGRFEEARDLVLGCLHLPSELHDKYLDCNLHFDEHAIVQSILNQRITQRIPAAYLLGQVWFSGMLFKVDRRAAIPNSPMEELIPQQFEPWLIQTPQRILDLYSGSGYLGICCAAQFPDAQVLLVDASSPALDLAADNIAEYGLAQRIKTQRSDGFKQLEGQCFDLIVCKPPYLSVEQWAASSRELQHEPQSSTIAKNGGLDNILDVLHHAGAHLTEIGLLVLEVGPHRMRLTALYPDLDFTWLEHTKTGSDVLALTAPQCAAYRVLIKG